MPRTTQLKPAKPFNPFYLLLLVVGTLFAVTACAYGVMTVQMLRMGQVGLTGAESLPPAEGAGLALLTFLDLHGFQLLMWELGALAVATIAAIGTDEFWTYRASLVARKSPAKES
jgi:hypothetical protein